MSKSLSYNYSGTKGHIVSVASSLPSSASTLLSQGWEDISDPRGAATGHHTYRETSTGLRIRFDRGTPGANGFAGRNHYHILNPNAHNSRDMYLDSQGNPVPKNSKKSHILPEEQAMTLDEFANKYNMHDSLINAITYENNTLQIDIDFAFWMQDWFIDGSSETGSLKVTFCNTSSYQHPDSLPLEDISILETSVIDDTITFALINDMTDEYLELVITASEVIVE